MIKPCRTTEPYLMRRNCSVVLPRGLVRGAIWRTFQFGNGSNAYNLDLFHGLSNELPIGLHRSNIPSVVTIHDVAFRTFTDMYKWADRQIYDYKWRYACETSDRIIAISECTKRDIIRFYNVPEEKIDIVYQPVNPVYYQDDVIRQDYTQNITDREYILYVGAVNSRKNLLGIVKALELIPESRRPALVVVGNGREYRQKVEQYIAEHNLDKWIIWANQIDNDQLIALYRNALMMVYPSFYEGFGLPIVEALLCACPVVTSNVSCLPEAGGPYSLMADPSSAEDIATQISRLLDDSDLCERNSRQGREWAINTFNPSKLAKDLLSVYERTLR